MIHAIWIAFATPFAEAMMFMFQHALAFDAVCVVILTIMAVHSILTR